MKNLILFLGLLGTSVSLSFAQSRVSIAPAYWFNYSPYSYHIVSTYGGSTTRTLTSGYDIVSSFGLTARYHFTPQWDVSVGAFYYRDTNYSENPKGPYGELAPFTSKGWQVPLLLNYRLTNHRLSPYFSTGAIIVKSETFTEAPIKTDGVVGVGLDYRFNSNLSLLFQPTGRYSFTKPVSDDSFQVTNYISYSIGAQVQLLWHF